MIARDLEKSLLEDASKIPVVRFLVRGSLEKPHLPGLFFPIISIFRLKTLIERPKRMRTQEGFLHL